ncbi:MAG: D-alanyl-D-alanine carboxypeptidase family protein [Streptosporangiales bacterium]
MLRNRRPALTAVALVTALTLTGLAVPFRPAAGASGLTALQHQAARLRSQADKATTALKKGTARYKAAKRTLHATQRELISTAQREEHAKDKVAAAHAKLVGYAVNAFRSPVGNDLSALLDGALASRAVARSTIDLTYLSTRQARAVAGYERQRARRAALHEHATALEHRAQRQEKQVAKRLHDLKARAKKVTKRLLGRLDRLTVRLAKAGRYDAAFQVASERMERSGEDAAACDKPVVANFPNGLIPGRLLCPLPERGEFLRPDAARAFWLLDTAYRARFGHHICITDSYRPLGEQYAVYRQTPALAAVPGTSKHGLGIALDLGCGIESYGSTAFNWMKQHAPRYGWVHPAWAEHDPFEPWHWEYTG